MTAPADIEGLTPEQLAEACARAMNSRDAAAHALAIAITEVRPGYSVAVMTVRPDMLNGHDVCHGGFVFALADTAFAYACNSRGHVNLAQSCSIDFIRPVHGGEILTATAEQHFKSGRSGLYDVTVRRANGEAVAHFRGRSYEIRKHILE
jgi:acyl-CoA thioesterase